MRCSVNICWTENNNQIKLLCTISFLTYWVHQWVPSTLARKASPLWSGLHLLRKPWYNLFQIFWIWVFSMVIVFSFYYIENISILKYLHVLFLALTCNLIQHNHRDVFLRTQPIIFKVIISNPKHKTKKKSVFRHCLSSFNSDNKKKVSLLLKTSIFHSDTNLVPFHTHWNMHFILTLFQKHLIYSVSLNFTWLFWSFFKHVLVFCHDEKWRKKMIPLDPVASWIILCSPFGWPAHLISTKRIQPEIVCV